MSDEILQVIEEELAGETATKEEIQLLVENLIGHELTEEEKEQLYQELLGKVKIEGEGFTINSMISSLQKDFPLLSKEEEQEILKEFYTLRVKAKELLRRNPSPVVNFLQNSSAKEIKSAFIDKNLTLEKISCRKYEWIEELERGFWPKDLDIRSIYLINFLKENGEKEVSERLRALRRKMILSNVRLVASVVGKYGTANYEDLFQEGIFGLEKALDKFDPYGKNNKFATYATWWIRQAVSRAFSEVSRVVKPPTGSNDPVSVVSISEPINEEGYSLEKIMASSIDVEEEVERKLMREDVRKSLSILNRIERRIVEMKYYKGMKSTEIAREIGITPSTVHQIEREALRKMKSMLIDYEEN